MLLEKLKTQIREVEGSAEAQDKKDEPSDQQKYEILFAKDQEMTQFLDGFEDTKFEEETKLKEKQSQIVIYLENISRAMALGSDASPLTQLASMEDELDFKSRQLQNSESTQNRLEAELAKREGELEKIESLDVKISQELQQVEAKMHQYERDIETKYDLVAEMKQQGESQLKRVEARKKSLEDRASALRRQVGFLKLRHESKRQQLSEDEVSCGLDTQEQKIRQFGQTLHTLKSFISQKSAEADFSSEMGTCMNVAMQINKMLAEQMQRPAACA